ncbi:hypothetical protein [Leptospira alexanderi]|nr:hypothetical protein [Leptospira alexanderi]
MFRPVGRNIELNSEGIGAKSAVASCDDDPQSDLNTDPERDPWRAFC